MVFAMALHVALQLSHRGPVPLLANPGIPGVPGSAVCACPSPIGGWI